MTIDLHNSSKRENSSRRLVPGLLKARERCERQMNMKQHPFSSSSQNSSGTYVGIRLVLLIAVILAGILLLLNMPILSGNLRVGNAGESRAASSDWNTAIAPGTKTMPPISLFLRCSKLDASPGELITLYVEVLSHCKGAFEIEIQPSEGLAVLGAQKWVCTTQNEMDNPVQTFEVPIRILSPDESAIVVRATMLSEDGSRRENVIITSRITLGRTVSTKDFPQGRIEVNSRGEKIIVTEGITTVRRE